MSFLILFDSYKFGVNDEPFVYKFYLAKGSDKKHLITVTASWWLGVSNRCFYEVGLFRRVYVMRVREQVIERTAFRTTSMIRRER